MLEFKLPEVGEGITSGTVIGISVNVGDAIKKDQDLLELETDKASLPVPAPCDGVVKEILIKDGDEVQIGTVVMKIEEGASATAAPAQDTPKADEPKAAAPQEAAPVPVQQPAAPAPAQSAPAPAPARTHTPLANEQIPAQTNIAASPATRRLARELGINLGQVAGTGPGGRITKDDVKAFTKQIVLSGGAAAPKPSKPLPDFSKWGEVSREAMSKIRKVTKDHMAHCWNTIPHVTQFDKADITELDQYRKDVSTDERKITVTSFLIKVLANALKEFPQFNCSIDADSNEIIYKKFVHVGVAVDTPNGLLVPVLRDVDKKGIVAITDDLNTIAQKARDRRVMPDDLQGGSMTVTNLGGIGGHAFTPIVNWPEVAILGVSRGGFEPVWNGKEFEPRLKLPLCLSYDHRIIDGADAARFLRWICTALEEKIEVN